MEYITQSKVTVEALSPTPKARGKRVNTAIYDCFYHSHVAVNMSEGSAVHMSLAGAKWMRLSVDVYTATVSRHCYFPTLVCVPVSLIFRVWLPDVGLSHMLPLSLSLLLTRHSALAPKFTGLCVCCLLSLTYDSFTPAVYSDQRNLMEFNPTKNWGDEPGENVTKARMRDSLMHADSRVPLSAGQTGPLFS